MCVYVCVYVYVHLHGCLTISFLLHISTHVGKSEIGVAVRGKLGGFVNSGELRDKLIEVYTGDKKAVAPEVVKILKKRYAKCK